MGRIDSLRWYLLLGECREVTPRISGFDLADSSGLEPDFQQNGAADLCRFTLKQSGLLEPGRPAMFM